MSENSDSLTRWLFFPALAVGFLVTAFFDDWIAETLIYNAPAGCTNCVGSVWGFVSDDEHIQWPVVILLGLLGAAFALPAAIAVALEKFDEDHTVFQSLISKNLYGSVVLFIVSIPLMFLILQKGDLPSLTREVWQPDFGSSIFSFLFIFIIFLLYILIKMVLIIVAYSLLLVMLLSSPLFFPVLIAVTVLLPHTLRYAYVFLQHHQLQPVVHAAPAPMPARTPQEVSMSDDKKRNPENRNLTVSKEVLTKDIQAPGEYTPPAPAEPKGYVSQVVSRFHATQERQTIEAQTKLIETQAEHIRARTDREAAVREHYDGKVKNALYAPDQVEATIEHEKEMSRLDREEALAEKRHQRLLAEKRRAEELAPPPEPPKPQRKRHVPKQRPSFEDKLDDIIEHGHVGPAMLAFLKRKASVANEYGGEEHIPENIQENLKIAFIAAQREDQSKG